MPEFFSDPIFQKTRFSRLAAKLGQLPKDGRPQVLMAGKSNAGKSSLINKLCRQNKLARTSSEAGKTRALIFFDVAERFYLVDLPGYGYSRSSQQERAAFAELTDSYLREANEIALILHIIDIRHLPSALDRQMISWLEAKEQPYLLLLNKADKLSRAQAGRAEQEIRREIRRELGLNPEMLRVSALSGEGIETLSQKILAAVTAFAGKKEEMSQS